MSDQPHLLSAIFEVNGCPYQVMIDTGATTSFIPEHGEIMKLSLMHVEPANLMVELADGKTEHISKKMQAMIKPIGSNCRPEKVYFYIQNRHHDIFGYHALIGLKHLKLFELSIDVIQGKIYVYHQGKLIGHESSGLINIKASVRVVDRFKRTTSEDNVQRILSRYQAVFAELDDKPIKGMPMRIHTVHQRPIFAKQRHYNADEIMTMKSHIKTLLEKRIIEPSNSGYAANSRIIPKKNGQGRLVINYIPLNAVTHRDSYALPHISDILGVVQGKEYFTTMDCTQGFYQIDVDKRDRHKTGFSTPFGNFQFRRCPFGARNSCAEFQRSMNQIFQEGLYTRCVIYVDDILVFGRSKEEHDQNLEWVLRKCLENNVKIKHEKCHFAKKEVQYLGFLISGTGIRPMPDKADTLLKSQPPRDKTELKSLLGKLNFYARFIPNYSKQLEPLRILLTKNKDYQWDKYHQQAFDSLISSFKKVDSQVLISRNEHKYIFLHIMRDSIEAVLTNSDKNIVSRCSRLLSIAESNYSTIEKQLLALVFAINKFRLLIDPDQITIKVPNNDLEKLFKLVNRPERVECLTLKLPSGFNEFKFEVDSSLHLDDAKRKHSHLAEEIFYVDGACKANGKPNCRASWAVCCEYDKDFERSGFVEESPSNQSAELLAAIKACYFAKEKKLSTITIVTDSKYLYSAATLWLDKWSTNGWKDHKNKEMVNVKLFKQLLEAKQGLDIEWIHVKGHADNVGNNRADALAKSLLCPKVATLCALSASETSIQESNPEIEQLKQELRKNQSDNLVLINDTVYFMDKKLPENCQLRVYVPKNARHHLLNLAHDDSMYGGHLGIRKTFRKLNRFWWPKMHQYVEQYVKSCDTCQKFKNPAGMPPGYLHSIPVSERFEHVHIDIIGPITPSYNGNRYIITATDAFSKWAFAKPCGHIETKDLINFLDDSILSVHGKPKIIITDRGSQFTSLAWKKYMDKIGVEHRLTTAYHPQTNGIDERLNGTLSKILRAYVDRYQEKWDEKLKWSLYVYNTTVHESTGYSPYQILHGKDNRSPLKPYVPDETSKKKTHKEILEDVFSRIKQAQENQKHYYDKNRKQHDLEIGLLVYTRVHAVPEYLSKKFYIKWHGPHIIIGFVGDEDNPRAVKIFDWNEKKKKIVAISDVKPYNARDPELDPHINSADFIDKSKPKGGDRHHDDVIDSQDLCSPGYYIDLDIPPEANHETHEHSSPDALKDNATDELDISQRNTDGVLTSSPKHVTISNTEDRIFQDIDHRPSAILPLTSILKKPNQPKVCYKKLDHPDNDKPTKDPTYEPSVVFTKPSRSQVTTRSQDKQPDLSISSESRYELRSRKRPNSLVKTRFQCPPYKRPLRRIKEQIDKEKSNSHSNKSTETVNTSEITNKNGSSTESENNQNTDMEQTETIDDTNDTQVEEVGLLIDVFEDDDLIQL